MKDIELKRKHIPIILLVVIVITGIVFGGGRGFSYFNQPPSVYSEIPEPYYDSVSQRYGVDALREYLGGWEWRRDYIPNVFDCTEMTSYLERDLENQGFHTRIIVGEYNGGGHAWLEVEIAPISQRGNADTITLSQRLQMVKELKQSRVIVEATTLSVISPDEAKGYDGSYSYETIYEAIKVSSSAFDWWN